MRRKPLEVRYTVTPSGCWEWLGCKNKSGYGRLNVGPRPGKGWLAHRYMYTMLVGSIPEGMQLDHLCNNPPCVNPAHMRVCTNAQNTRRSSRATMTQAIADEIRRRYNAGGTTFRKLAADMGLGKGAVDAVLRGVSWT